MTRFDIHMQEGKQILLLNCQSDYLSHLSTRFVIPLISTGSKPPIATRLNPVFNINASDYVLATNAAATLSLKHMGGVIGSLAHEQDKIIAAIDILVSGF